MILFGITLPPWVFDWAGSLLVAASLVYLVRKDLWYWHFSNASLLPYFLLFALGAQYMLAGLQVSYLIFGLHGMYLWRLERRRDQKAIRFNEPFWYNLGWVLTLLIFLYTCLITRFVDGWAWMQFVIVSLSLLANWATTRKWTWSWYVWIEVNLLQILYFAHFTLWAQFGLQFVLIAMSVWGLIVWRQDDRERSRVYGQALPARIGGGEVRAPASRPSTLD